MEAQNKNIKILVKQCKRAPDLVVGLCIPFDCCKHCLSQLQANIPMCEGTEECMQADNAALAYAVFNNIKYKLIGSPLETYRTRVSHINCNVQNKHFIISWNTMGSFSSLRKTCGIAASGLNPGSLQSKYIDNIRLLGMKPNRDAFDAAAHAMSKAITESVDIIAVGKVVVDAPKLKIIAEIMSKKLPDMKDNVAPKTKTSRGTKQCELPEYPTIAVAYGVPSVVLADYISAKLKVMVSIEAKDIRIYNTRFGSKLASLKSGIADFVGKYEKLGDDLAGTLAYIAVAKYCVDCTLVAKIIKGNITPKSLSEMLNKAF